MKQQTGLNEIRQRCRNIWWLSVSSMWQVTRLIDAKRFGNPACDFNLRFQASLKTRFKLPGYKTLRCCCGRSRRTRQRQRNITNRFILFYNTLYKKASPGEKRNRYRKSNGCHSWNYIRLETYIQWQVFYLRVCKYNCIETINIWYFVWQHCSTGCLVRFSCATNL